jgi:O-antigen ligase
MSDASAPSASGAVSAIHTDGPPMAARLSSGRAKRGVLDASVSALCFLLVLAAGTLGGGQGGLGDTFAQLLSLLPAALMLWMASRGELRPRAAGWVPLLVLLPLALPLLQLLPLPGWLLGQGPARRELALQLSVLNLSLPGRISLDPVATEAALWHLVPALVLFIAVLTRSGRTQRWILLALFAIAIAGVLLGMAQEAAGTGELRLYERTNRDQAVGLFANRNHFAGMLAMLLPIAIGWVAWAVAERLEHRRMSPVAIVTGVAVIVMLVFGIALSRSRAGLLLALLGVLATAPVLLSLNRQKGARRFLLIVGGICALFTVQFSLLGAVPRLLNSGLEDGRWSYARTTISAAKAYLPWGSGLGTFRNAYQPFEAKAEPTRYIINHAHDDYLELALEGGIPALVLLALGLGVWSWRGLQLLRPSPGGPPDAALASLLRRCAWLGASMGLLHSAMDFPLRTTAAMSVFAVLAAIAFSESTSGSRRAALLAPTRG